MKFLALELSGAFLVEDERQEDERGGFARTFCAEEFGRQGLETCVAQCSLSTNRSAGTLRGMHYQLAPFAEAKLIRCVAGRVFDVLLDLRDGSPGFGRWVGIELAAGDGRAVYAPPGLAHGFQTLTVGAALAYQISAPYSPKHSAAVRWNDPAFGIRWPLPDPILSARDRDHPDFARTRRGVEGAS